MNMHATQFAPAAPAFNAFEESTMLARFSLSIWQARKLDKAVTAKATADHGAVSRAGRFNKSLLSSDSLKAVGAAASAARDCFYSRTLPWRDDGVRILLTPGFEKYALEMRTHRETFFAAVDSFIAEYPTLIEKARVELGDMFRESDYPLATDLAGRFAFAFSFEQFPAVSDFRVNLGDETQARLRAEIQASTDAAVSAAMQSVWTRIAETVGHMAERLRAYNPDAENRADKGIFHDSMVANIRELADILPTLNMTNDAKLAEISARIAAELTGEDSADLRKHAAARETVAAAAESILADMSDYFA